MSGNLLYVVHMQSIYCLLCFILIFKFFISSVHLLDMHNLCFLDGRLLNVLLFFPCYCLIFDGLSQYFVYSHQMKGALPAQRGARTDDHKVKSLALWPNSYYSRRSMFGYIWSAPSIQSNFVVFFHLIFFWHLGSEDLIFALSRVYELFRYGLIVG